MPFGQVPVLTVGGKQYHQHIALARFLGKQVKLAGTTPLEDLEIDIVVDTINDLRQKMATYYREANPTLKETLKTTLFNETAPYYLERLEKIAKDNNGYLACNRLTWADLYFAGSSDAINFVAGDKLVEKYPNLMVVRDNVESVPAIKEWVKIRPKSDM